MTESVDTRKAKTYGPYEFALGDELRGERATLGRSLLDIQRDLRIKAAYIAAIEDCDASVFPNPGFIAGYVRSYARYLGLDPEEVYWRFCQESGFTGAHSAASGKGTRTSTPGRGRPSSAGEFRPVFPLADSGRRRLLAIPFAAIGSLLVLVALIGGLGYGGWAILQNIQRVQFAPVDEVPVALAELPDLTAPGPETAEPVLPELGAPVAATALVDLYRQQELEVPILEPRDGPIAALDPDAIGLLAEAGARQPTAPAMQVQGPPLPTAAPASDASELAAEDDPDAKPRLTVIAERPAWVRIYFENGTVLFEQILESGEIYDVPATPEVPLIWAGNSGSVYVRVGEVLHGPIGSGTRAVRDVVLDPQAIGERFEPVGALPSVISDAISNLAQQDLATVRR